MNVVLVRVGIDTGCGGIHSPIFSNGEFEFVPIPDSHSVDERTYGNAKGRAGRAFVEYFPDRKRDSMRSQSMHVDPEFETFTYGDPTPPKRNLSQLQPGEAVEMGGFRNVVHIGIGVAQSLPIVVGALDSRGPFLAVEQPELHLHPAAQARLGDLFVAKAKQERLFLIETHSETLMLRIFRRIRETTRNKLPQQGLELTKDDVSLLFVVAGEGGAQIKPIRLDDQGKFVDPVPGGFFEEGFSELF